jgi:uncharacterized membrane protein YgcG
VQIVLSKTKKKTTISTGVGIQTVVPDAFTPRIVDDNTLSKLKVGLFFDGIFEAHKS